MWRGWAKAHDDSFLLTGSGQVHEASSLADEHIARQHNRRTRARPGHLREGPVEVLRPSRLNELKPYPSAHAATSAAFSMSFSVGSPWPPGCQRAATRLTAGTASLSCSRHLPTSSGEKKDNPVTLPPGRARLVTSPLVTGIATETMGRVLVACLAARAAAVLGATMTSTLSATSSAARAGSCSDFPSADRYSMTRLRPST